MIYKNVRKFILGRADFYWEYNKKGICFLKKENKKAKRLSEKKLLGHFEGKVTLGFSPFIDNERVMFCGLDFDAHTSKELTEEQNNNLILEAKEDSEKVFEYLKSLNLPVVLNSSGSKGRHVRITCEGEKGKDARIFLKYILGKVLGDNDKHEIFPKQDLLCKERPFGNQMKGMLGIHPKYNKRANIISNGKILDLAESIKYIDNIINNLDKYSKIKTPTKDYKRLLEEVEKKIIRVDSLDKSNVNYSSQGNVPKYCAVMEEIICKYCLPSKGTHTRHACIDPNIASYGITHPKVKKEYAQKQGRVSDTAFRNWSKYWGDSPIFKCSQIIGYLKYHSKSENHCKDGLKKCLNCPTFKNFQIKEGRVKGWAISLNIRKIAEEQNMLKCPKCNSDFIFNELSGYYKCKYCKTFGGLKSFALLCYKNKLEVKNDSS